MARTLPTGAVGILQSKAFITCELIELDLDTPLYLTTAQFDIATSTTTSGGTQQYVAQGQFLAYSGVREIDEVRINNINVTFSGATNTFINIALNGNYLHRAFRIYKVFLNNADMALLTTPIMIYDGTIVGASVEESETDSTVTFQTSNEFYDFERIAGRKTNSGSQQRFYAGDRGMEYSTVSISDIRWGRKS
jgi:hypothetical protein